MEADQSDGFHTFFPDIYTDKQWELIQQGAICLQRAIQGELQLLNSLLEQAEAAFLEVQNPQLGYDRSKNHSPLSLLRLLYDRGLI
jgi:hypothetical protein